MARRARVLQNQQAGEHPQALRRHLITVTQHLLATEGLTGLTTRAIARAAEVSDGVLYNHFANKDDLVVEAIAEQISRLVPRFLATAPVPGEQDLRSGLDRFARLSLELQAEALPLIGVLMSRPDLFHRLFERLHDGDRNLSLLAGRVYEFVGGEQRLGRVAPGVDPGIVAQVLFGVSHLQVLFLLMRGAGPESTPPEGMAGREQLVDFLLRACTAAEP